MNVPTSQGTIEWDPDAVGGEEDPSNSWDDLHYTDSDMVIETKVSMEVGGHKAGDSTLAGEDTSWKGSGS